MKKQAIALAASTAMFSGAFTVPAQAATTPIDNGVAITQDDTNGAFTGINITPGRTSTLNYSHPYSSAGMLPVLLQADTYVGSIGWLNPDASNTKVTSRTDGGVDVVVLTTKVKNVTAVRTMRFAGNTVKVDVEINAPGETVQIDLSSNLGNKPFTAAYEDGTYQLTPQTPGFEAKVRFGDNPLATVAVPNFAAGNTPLRAQEQGHIAQDGATYQRGRWFGYNGTLKASMEISLATQASAADRDGDGLPDLWEEEGVTLADGTFLNLPAWGADSQKQDLFLQLNWMPSEWEHHGCASRDRYDATVNDYLSYAQCAQFNKNTYRPSREVLQQLEQIFAEADINLHIDAGPIYAPTIPLDETAGGISKNLPYKENFFKQEVTSDDDGMLEKLPKLLAGDRSSVFHVGVIGDKQAAGNLSSGLGQEGAAFFVAKGAGLTTDQQLLGTILHEFGHVLGLGHDGAETEESLAWKRENPGQDRNYMPAYKSVMNYLYQFSLPRFTSEATVNKKIYDSQEAIRAEYPDCAGAQCYLGPYTVPADWDNLRLRGKEIGNVDGILPPAHEHDHDHDDHEHDHDKEAVYKLTVNSALENNKTAGLKLNDDAEGGNGISLQRANNRIHVTLDNQGIDAHEFTLHATWGTGQEHTSQPIALASALDEKNYTRDYTIPLDSLAGVRGAETDITITLTNAEGKQVFSEVFSVPVLDYTADEAAKVREEAKKADLSAEQRKRVAADLPTAPAPTTTATAAATPPPSVAPAPAPAPGAQQDGRALSGGAIIAIILGLLGALAAGAGSLASMR